MGPPPACCWEHPKAADTLGVNVFKVRYICDFGGLLAGLQVRFVLGSIGYFEQAMLAGVYQSGAMILENTPIGSFGADCFSDFLNHWRPICLFSISVKAELLLISM